jgi:hypothetical protein
MCAMNREYAHSKKRCLDRMQEYREKPTKKLDGMDVGKSVDDYSRKKEITSTF